MFYHQKLNVTYKILIEFMSFFKLIYIIQKNNELKKLKTKYNTIVSLFYRLIDLYS